MAPTAMISVAAPPARGASGVRGICGRIRVSTAIFRVTRRVFRNLLLSIRFDHLCLCPVLRYEIKR
ncbi:protein of unknown function [Streptomyces sp. KY75]|nr:protein of unknown function [Streptomyces sp. KY70]CAD5990776.1 protein of unknown function [Streptomyces sp. KY75]